MQKLPKSHCWNSRSLICVVKAEQKNYFFPTTILVLQTYGLLQLLFSLHSFMPLFTLHSWTVFPWSLLLNCSSHQTPDSCRWELQCPGADLVVHIHHSGTWRTLERVLCLNETLTALQVPAETCPWVEVGKGNRLVPFLIYHLSGFQVPRL